jgi:hypothetical protein
MDLRNKNVRSPSTNPDPSSDFANDALEKLFLNLTPPFNAREVVVPSLNAVEMLVLRFNANDPCGIGL